VIVDTTVQPKNVIIAIDAKLIRWGARATSGTPCQAIQTGE
jgi:hypothetical protein